MLYRCAAGTLALMLMFSSPLGAASTDYKGYHFDAKVLKSNGKIYREFVEHQQNTLKVRPNEEYSIVVYNPLPVRAAVAVSIDGLNTIDGQRTTPRNAKKWMVGPKSSITIAGWQTSKQTLRKFLFTEQDASFAQWREDKDGKKYSKNLGVIGVAWFWNSNELEAALHPPQPFEDEPRAALSARDRGKSAAAPSAAGKAESRAGTGMGREEYNQVTTVAFNGNVGMFAVKDVLKIFYEFAEEPAQPQPFVDDEEDERFTPDMTK